MRAARRSTARRLADHRTELEDRQVHGDDHAADEYAQDGHDHGLQEARHAVDGVVDLDLVELRYLPGHGVEGTGFLADSDHLDDHVREQAGVLHHPLQALAGGYFVFHAVDRFLVDDIAGGTCHRPHGLYQRNTGGKHGGKCTREARDRSLDEDGSDDREFEHDSIHRELHLPRPLQEVEERIEPTADQDGAPPALVLNESREVHDHLGEGGQIGAEALE